MRARTRDSKPAEATRSPLVQECPRAQPGVRGHRGRPRKQRLYAVISPLSMRIRDTSLGIILNEDDRDTDLNKA